MGSFTTALHSALQTYRIPDGKGSYFAKVFRGEPLNLMPSAGQPIARWHILRAQVPPEGARVLTGNRQTALVFGVDCYWALSPVEGAQQQDEDDIAIVLVDLPNAFVQLGTAPPPGYTIGNYPVAVTTVEDTTTVDRTTPFSASPQEMRVASFEVHARILEATP